ncbi:hypothetical protein [Fredinandcohnia onubensis]|uniref:hypothetical protein n=1 Tax=Fredinandcohnia onubensis TaxID=1571209 RepID=UPI000C0BCE09|nr:hypothetical protein [Fredinandcohnia onubensis]
MPLENIGLTVSTIGCILGISLIIFGGLFYLLENKNRVMIAKASKTLGIGIFMVTLSIPFSIPNHLLAESTSDDILGIIILSIFLGFPLIFIGLASYIALNAKAHEILNLTSAQEKIIYFSPMQKKKVL